MTDDASRHSSLHAPERALRKRLIDLPRRSKQLLMLSTDAAGFFGCLVLCGWLQLIDPVFRADGLLLTASTLAATHLLARFLGFYHSIVRYLGMNLLMAGARVAAGSAIFLALIAWYSGLTSQPAQLAVVYGAFCGLYLVGSRYMAQYYLVRRASDKDNVIIYGAGESGARVLQAMQGNHSFHPVAFIDDDPAIQDKQISGLRVYASSSLNALIGKHDVSRVLLALPSASRRRRHEIIESLEELPVHVQTVPDFNDLISGKARVDDIREVDVEDLLTRSPVAPEDTLMQATLLGKSVMVTGAGGSIGSELCRQILRVGPATLVLFELSEVALYTIDKEMRALAGKLGIDCEIVPLLGSVQDFERVREVMQHFEVHTVYHAAAYKHVPLVEQNIVEGVCNNVFGTYRTAMAAIQARVKTFVLVSTDKAVSPTSVMGASKRMAELALQSFQDTTDITRFAMVRFGNVLESSGSVVPLFREQIKNGGPVTVTHPEIIRYFMTIPEAAQLVIQAGGMARGGEVFVLDMGEPVKIRDLAQRMVRLMGLTVRDDDNPHGDIEIHYTGLRPAEKLYEELLIGDNVAGTEHPRIMQAREDYLPTLELAPLLQELQRTAEELDCCGVRDTLIRAVREYRPENGVDDLLCRGRDVPAEEEQKVVSIEKSARWAAGAEPPTA
jgi:FlaA1/EpsC-like NDP-sugar epimerase